MNTNNNNNITGQKRTQFAGYLSSFHEAWKLQLKLRQIEVSDLELKGHLSSIVYYEKCMIHLLLMISLGVLRKH